MKSTDDILIERLELEVPKDYICVEIDDDEVKFTHKTNQYDYEKNDNWILKMLPYIKGDTKRVECQECKHPLVDGIMNGRDYSKAKCPMCNGERNIEVVCLDFGIEGTQQVVKWIKK